MPTRLDIHYGKVQPAPDLPKDATCVPLKVFAGRVFIPATLNGQVTCDCLIDTGAEVSLINKARVPLKDLPVLGTEQIQGAFVGAVAMQKTRLKSLSIGQTTYQEVAFRAIEHRKGQKLEQIDMTLGIDFLSRSRFTLDFAREQFVIWPPRSPLPPPPASIERVRVNTHRASGDGVAFPRIYGTVNEKAKALFLVDTGAGPFYFVALKKAEEYGFPTDGPVVATMRLNDGGNSREIKIRETLIQRLDFEQVRLQPFTGKVVEAQQVVGPLAKQDLQVSYTLIGTPVLKTQSAVHFDMPSGCIYFDRPKAAAAGKKSE